MICGEGVIEDIFADDSEESVSSALRIGMPAQGRGAVRWLLK